MNVHLYAWIITVVVMIGDAGRRHLHHRPAPARAVHERSRHGDRHLRRTGRIFGLAIWAIAGPRYAGEFYAGWLTEYSLSVDNLFIFLIIMTSLKVPRQLQQFALLVGIILALIFRGIFIAVGAAAINRYSWVFFIFGAFLLYTAVKLVIDYRKHDDESTLRTTRPCASSASTSRPTDDYHGTKLTMWRTASGYITPMLVVIVALGSTDLLFALDSIPAIYGLTQEPYLVFTANVFALMGLRQLYFLLGGLLRKLVYLSIGLSVILAFIGVKLIFHAMHDYHLDEKLGIPFSLEIPIWLSLSRDHRHPDDHHRGQPGEIQVRRGPCAGAARSPRPRAQAQSE